MPRKFSHREGNKRIEHDARRLENRNRAIRREYGEVPRPSYEVPQEELPPQNYDRGRGAESPLGGRQDLLPGEASHAARNPAVGTPRAPR